MQPATTMQQGNWTRNSAGYQTLLVFLLSLNFGIVFFDRQAHNVLMPQIQPDLMLTQTQIGLIAGGLSFSWAIAAFFVGKLSDTLGKRKILLVLSTIAFSLTSFLTGLATSFALLFGARLLMGVAEGGVMPISHAMVASEVDPAKRGLAQGVAQNLGSNLLGSFLAPALLVPLALAFGWQNAFFVAGVPGILSALLMWFLLKEPEPIPRDVDASGRSKIVAVLLDILFLMLLPFVLIYVSVWMLFTPSDHPKKRVQPNQTITMLDALRIPNIWIIAMVGILMVAHFVTTWAFMPLYLSQVKGYDLSTGGWIMSSLGIAAAIYSFAISGLSDRIGRKPVMVWLPFLSVVGPLAALYYEGPAIILVAFFFVGWAVNGIFPIFMATIPSESVDPHHHATVLGLAMGSCEILGGVFGPPLAGMLNDAFGPDTFLWMLMILAVTSGFIAMGLKETAPMALARRGSLSVVSP